MAQILIRQLDDDLKARLRRRARRHGHNTEQEVREILVKAVRQRAAISHAAGSRITASLAGIDLEGEISEPRGQLAPPAPFET